MSDRLISIDPDSEFKLIRRSKEDKPRPKRILTKSQYEERKRISRMRRIERLIAWRERKKKWREQSWEYEQIRLIWHLKLIEWEKWKPMLEKTWNLRFRDEYTLIYQFLKRLLKKLWGIKSLSQFVDRIIKNIAFSQASKRVRDKTSYLCDLKCLFGIDPRLVSIYEDVLLYQALDKSFYELLHILVIQTNFEAYARTKALVYAIVSRATDELSRHSP